MINYLQNQYFKSNKKEIKKYYFDLYLKEYLKKIKVDNTDLLESYFKEKKQYYNNQIDQILYEFESRTKK
jgi:hypothetical protein